MREIASVCKNASTVASSSFQRYSISSSPWDDARYIISLPRQAASRDDCHFPSKVKEREREREREPLYVTAVGRKALIVGEKDLSERFVQCILYQIPSLNALFFHPKP